MTTPRYLRTSPTDHAGGPTSPYRAWSRPRASRPPTKLLVIVYAVLAAILVGCSPADDRPDGDDPPANSTNMVELRDIQFTPATLTVEAGEEVTWIWEDGTVEHNVVGDDFESDILNDGTFTETFEEPGSYDYVCTLHPGMEGTIVVTRRLTRSVQKTGSGDVDTAARRRSRCGGQISPIDPRVDPRCRSRTKICERVIALYMDNNLRLAHAFRLSKSARSHPGLHEAVGNRRHAPAATERGRRLADNLGKGAAEATKTGESDLHADICHGAVGGAEQVYRSFHSPPLQITMRSLPEGLLERTDEVSPRHRGNLTESGHVRVVQVLPVHQVAGSQETSVVVTKRELRLPMAPRFGYLTRSIG